MQPHQERVVVEKQELDEKMSKLHEFISKSPLFEKLSELEQTLLRNQHKVMMQYSSILGQRLSLWEA